mmetsp:Transcript_14779/g.25146  ORF Transcript_14779/g.25146 Transcript_14779/m.25146 type:complete len:286 (+) Transcript_14779:369-1226(+)
MLPVQTTLGNFSCWMISLSFWAYCWFLVKTMTWLKSRSSSSWINFRIFWFSSSFTKYCFRPCSTSFESLSMKSSNGSFMNFLQTCFVCSGKVAENISTCFSEAHLMKIFCTCSRMSVSSMSLSHSSSTKILLFSPLMWPSLMSSMTRPGVPIMMWGAFSGFLRIFMCSWMGWPPRKACLRTQGMNSVKRSNSFLIWLASSLTFPRMMAYPDLAVSCSIWLRMAMMKTAVFPMPARAWQMMSLPSMAWGMHCCCTSEGCSKPLCLMALFSSLLSRNSLKPVLWTPV